MIFLAISWNAIAFALFIGFVIGLGIGIALGVNYYRYFILEGKKQSLQVSAKEIDKVREEQELIKIKYIEWKIKWFVNILKTNMKSLKDKRIKSRYPAQIRLLKRILADIEFAKTHSDSELKKSLGDGE